jgi:predicted DNA-binding transcriptional regulator YafY
MQGLFPLLDTQFIRELFDSRVRDVFSIHGPNHEDLRVRLDDFLTLQRAITQRRCLRFSYAKNEGIKNVEVAPYRLMNSNGVWYLAAVHDKNPKAYAFNKLYACNINAECSPSSNPTR